MQAYSAWTRIPPGLTCCVLLLLSESIGSLVLLLRYSYSWHGGGWRVLKLCPACIWSPCLLCLLCPVGNRSPAELWGAASHGWHVIANGPCRLCSEKPCLSCRGLWLWGRCVLRPKGVQIEMSQDLAPTLSSALQLFAVTWNFSGPPGRNKYFRRQNPKAR